MVFSELSGDKISGFRADCNCVYGMDLTHIYCGVDGWGHLAAVIDCHDREIVGYEFALRGRAKEAEPKKPSGPWSRHA